MVLDHGSHVRLDGQCVSHAFVSVAYVFLMIVVNVLVAYAWCWSCL